MNARAAAQAALAATRPRAAIGDDAIAHFIARASAQGSVCTRLDTLAELPGWLLRTFAAEGAMPPLHASRDPALRDVLDGATGIRIAEPTARPLGALGIAIACAGIAETGSAALHARAEAPAALNFLPDTLVVVIEAARIVPQLEDFWAFARAHFGGTLPRALQLVSGPSSSGDIAMTFAFGVHGPIACHFLIIGAAAPPSRTIA